MNEQIGYKDTANMPSGESLLGRLNGSPTGRQLGIDGAFVKAVYTQDPAAVLLSPTDGIEVTWNNAGVLKDCKFTRETGWAYSAAYT